jgi:acetyl-CoA acetyltransferase
MNLSAPLQDARIVGVYTTRQARSLEGTSGFALALEAMHGALDDAGMDISEVDGIASRVSGGWPYGGHGGGAATSFWARQLQKPMHWGSATTTITDLLDAARAITAGQVSTVVFTGGGAREQSEATAAWTRPVDEFTEWTGNFTAVQYGLVAQRYMHEYGADAIYGVAEAAATIRNYGNINPNATFFGRGPYTAEDVLNSRPIASPLTLLMCASVNDGGMAIVMTHKERARDTRKTPISIICGSNQISYPPYFEAPVLDAVKNEGAFVRETLGRAGLTHNDFDFVELYDHFAIGVLTEFELYGFCGYGEAPDFVRNGVMRLDGRYPTCTDGGNLSFSHNGSPHQFRIIEAIRQLRGEVVDLCPGWEQGEHTYDPNICRKVRDAKVAFVSNQGPPTGGGAFFVLTRD